MSDKLIGIISGIFIIGGVEKIIFVIDKYIKSQASDYVLTIYLAFYGFSVLSGLLFFINKKIGAYLLLSNSLIQVILINVGSIAWLYSVSIVSYIYIDSDYAFQFIFGLGGFLSIGYFPDREYIFEAGINLILIVFSFLIGIYIKDHQE